MGKQQKVIREIWMLSREYGDLAGAGGVKDVVAQLSVALAGNSRRAVHVVIPCYGFMDPVQLGFEHLADPSRSGKNLQFKVDLDFPEERRLEQVTVWFKEQGRVTIYLVEAERFREKLNVYTYTAEEEQRASWQKAGEGHVDFFAMNILLQKAAIALMILLKVRPDVVHCHDGHTAVFPAMISELPGLRHYFRDTGCVVTVHNAGKGYHQEIGDLGFAQAVTGLPSSLVYDSLLDGRFDPFLAGSPYAVMNTVSENYARELRETVDDHLTGWLGHELLNRNIVLEGVTNGIAPDVFSAKKKETAQIAAGFDLLEDAVLEGKMQCKVALLKQLAGYEVIPGIQKSGVLDPDPSIPLITFIGRLSAQKGVSILISALQKLLSERGDFRFLLLGSGDKYYEENLVYLSELPENRGRMCVLRGFDTVLANKIYAAGDFFVIPSQYEPCGLTDFMAQLFGNIPIVHAVGGLVKVVDGKTGFSYEKQSPVALCEAIARALHIYSVDPGALREMQRQAVLLIHERYTWETVSEEYLQLYKQARQEKMAG